MCVFGVRDTSKDGRRSRLRLVRGAAQEHLPSASFLVLSVMLCASFRRTQ
jgi:hypothetical protein